MASYEGKAPLTMCRTAAPTTYVSVLAGAPVPENIDPDDLKRLVDEGFLVKVSGKAAKAEEPADSKPTKVDDIVAAVGDDKVLAQEYLDAENAAEKPRVSLVEKLQAVIDAEA